MAENKDPVQVLVNRLTDLQEQGTTIGERVGTQTMLSPDQSSITQGFEWTDWARSAVNGQLGLIANLLVSIRGNTDKLVANENEGLVVQSQFKTGSISRGQAETRLNQLILDSRVELSEAQATQRQADDISFEIETFIDGFCFGDTSIVYGTADIIQVFEQPEFDSTARKTVTASFSPFFKPEDPANPAGPWTLDPGTFTARQKFNVCPVNPAAAAANDPNNIGFLDEPAPGFCSGVCVGPNLIATANHCLFDLDSLGLALEDMLWIFDFRFEVTNPKLPAALPPRYSSSLIWKAKRIVANQFIEGRIDWAVIEIENVGDPSLSLGPERIAPVMRDNNFFSSNYTKGVYMIGSPNGTPLKFTGPADVTGPTFGPSIPIVNVADAFFNTNLDAFRGNSGAPVWIFDASNPDPTVIGLLIGGDPDLKTTAGKPCKDVNTVPNPLDFGKRATKTITFQQFIP